MSLRMTRKGTGYQIKDHNELVNKGKYTHERLDALVDEVEEARGGHPSLNDRFDDLLNRIENMWVPEIPGGQGGGSCTDMGGYLYFVYECTEEGVYGVTVDEGSFLRGRDSLEVFRGGLRMIIDDDYTEVNNTTIRFKDVLRKGEIVVLRVRDRSGVTSNLRLHSEAVIVGQPTEQLTVNHKFQDGRGVEVYVNGVLNNPATDYTLGGQSTVNFKYTVPKGSLINVIVSDKISKEEPLIIQEKFLTGESQDYTLTRFSYNRGMDELELYIEGVKQTLDVDYIETSPTSFRLLDKKQEGLVILACKENPGAITGAHMHSYGVVPVGEIDGENKEFYLTHIPQVGSVVLYVGGIRQSNQFFEVEGNKITIAHPPPKGIDLFVDYVM